MLDIQLLRKDIDAVVSRLATRGPHLDAPAIKSRFVELDAARKASQTLTEELQAKRNALVKQVGALKAKGQDAGAVQAESAGVGEQVAANEKKLAGIIAEFEALLASTPNMPDASVPIGKSADNNAETRRVGAPRTFDFPVKDHV